MEPLVYQMHVFTVTLAIGMAGGFCYDYYRVLRRLFKLRKIGTYFGDVIFWLVTTALVFYLLLLVNWGAVRFYVFVALSLGAMIYFWLFSKMSRRLLTLKFYLLHKLWKLTITAILFTLQVIFSPVRIVVIILSYPLRYLRQLLIQAGRRFRRTLHNPLGRRVERILKKPKLKLQGLVFWKKRKED